MTLNEWCIKAYGRDWIRLSEEDRKKAIEQHKSNKALEDLFGGLFK